jgi:hypothetical protein
VVVAAAVVSAREEVGEDIAEFEENGWETWEMEKDLVGWVYACWSPLPGAS